LAIIGYDDIEFASFTNPPLSTVAQPKNEIGSQATRLLVERIADKTAPTLRLVLLPELIIRGSTRPEALPAQPAVLSEPAGNGLD
jgi:DNA-binding LacI/PurR family transcriptional regulator